MNKSARILVTGASGFIGSHLVNRLLADGYWVRAMDQNPSLVPSHLRPQAQPLMGNLCDSAFLKSAVQDVDWIFHLAAQSSVARSLSHPEETIEINEKATSQLLKFALEFNVKGVIFSSTSAVYGQPESLPNVETHTTQPISAYGKSKLAAEGMIREICARNPNFRSISLRYFNIYGPGQKASTGAVVPRFVEAAHSGQKIQIHGDGKQTRDFVYVDDVIEANLKSLQRLSAMESCCDIFNVASGTAVSVLELKERVEKLSQKRLNVEFLPERPGEIRHSYASCERAKQTLQFNAHVPLIHGLTQVIQSSVIA